MLIIAESLYLDIIGIAGHVSRIVSHPVIPTPDVSVGCKLLGCVKK
jgi:hypothetical protein